MKVRVAAVSMLLVALVAPISARALDVDALRQALTSDERSADDRARDAGRKPAETLAYLGIEPGMTVVDLIAAGGYFTEVLSLAVGPSGKVYAQNTQAVLAFRDGANEKAISARLANDRLPNVARLDREMSDLGLAPGSIDAAITALNFHDIYNGGGADAAQGFLAAVLAILKPGGVLGIVDHSGAAGADNAKLHRIEKSIVVGAAERAGFVVDGDSDLLRNAADDHTKAVFDPSIRGQTDQFLLRLRKPN